MKRLILALSIVFSTVAYGNTTPKISCPPMENYYSSVTEVNNKLVVVQLCTANSGKDGITLSTEVNGKVNHTLFKKTDVKRLDSKLLNNGIKFTGFMIDDTMNNRVHYLVAYHTKQGIKYQYVRYYTDGSQRLLDLDPTRSIDTSKNRNDIEIYKSKTNLK